MDQERAHAAVDDMLLDLRRRRVRRNIARVARCVTRGAAARALAMLCDTSYTTCMSRSSGVHVNILANACAAGAGQDASRSVS